jgi:ribose transport system permease protein
VPLPAWIFGGLLFVAHLTLTRTTFGRQVYAVGHDIEAARKAGLRTSIILTKVYLISGVCAAIAAAVLGGTSLFGGRGSVLPGTLLGALLIQTIENGLVIMNANPYLYSMVISVVIFTAVFLESLRNQAEKRLSHRTIRPLLPKLINKSC